jgi:hypothetical protein
MKPSIAELQPTVDQMEQRLRADPEAAVMMRVYDDLTARFEADLEDERVRLLSRSAALMLIQGLFRRATPSPPTSSADHRA